jgi:peroxiredoxin
MLKSLYISAYISGAVSGLVWSLFQVASDGIGSPWLGTAIACAGPALFFATVFALPIARTSPNLNVVLGAGVVGSAVAATLAGALAAVPVVVALAVGVAGTLGYVHWYSCYGAPGNDALAVGKTLPDFPLVEEGREVSRAELTRQPALWIFYRGNWCPLCVAQIGEICAQYRSLAEQGVEVFLVSPQPEENLASLRARCDAPMRYMTARGNRAAEKLGILVRDGIPAGLQALGYDSDTTRPTVFITDREGKIAYVDMTDNYRVRPEPAQYLPILERVATA